ncbi:MAG: TetR family transcriptional regulator [Lachnospiraceae bacterium]|nr:TetR family transcriptional regulator [Lachnospiraceae bacterium]
MEFQRARTQEQIENRQNEIISACQKIYMDEGYEEVTLKKISDMTSFTRPALYSYYKSKEEIFLDILKEEFALWQADLTNRCADINEYSRELFCTILTDSMCERTTLLELLAVHLNTIENNTRLERLVEFKKTVYHCFDTLTQIIDCFFPLKDESAKKEFFDLFITYLNGLYPHIFHSKIQKQAMELTGRPHMEKDLRQVCYQNLLLLTSNLQ